MTKTIVICCKCAYESMAQMKPISQKTEKETCALCGRRRFCLVYEVKEEANERTDSGHENARAL